jgi:hypothetical protein
LKGKLSAEKLKIGELQTQIAELEAKVAERPLTPADTIIAELEDTNKKLTRELEAAMQSNIELESELDDREGSPIPTLVVEGFSKLVLAVIGIALLLAFGAGLYFMDYLNRRRHGGFRI